MRVLGNPYRLAILCLLLEGELSVMQIETMLDIHQPTLSQQLTTLREAGLIASRREAKHVFYRVADPRVAPIVGTLRNFYSELLPPETYLVTGADTQDRATLAEIRAMARLSERESM